MYPIILLFSSSGELIFSSPSASTSLKVEHIDDLLFLNSEKQKVLLEEVRIKLQLLQRIDIDVVLGAVTFAGQVTLLSSAEGEALLVTLKSIMAEDERDSPENVKKVMACAQIASWEWNVKTGALHVNDRWAGILGYSLESILPVNYTFWLNSVAEEYRNDFQLAMQRHLDGKDDYFEFEYPIESPAKKNIWVRDFGRVVSYDSDNQPLWVYGARIDISRGKTALLELERVQNQLDHIMELSPLIIYRMNADEDESLELVTNGISNLLGYDGNSILNVPHWWRSHIHPDDIAEYERCRYLTKRRRYHPIMDCEYRFINAAGEEIWLIDRIRYVESTQRDPYFVGAVIDVSEFISLNQHLKTLSILPPGLIYQFEIHDDGSMSFPYVSLEFENIFGVSPDEAAKDANLVFAAVFPEDMPQILKLTDIVNFEKKQTGEFRIKRHGMIRWYYFQATPMKVDEDGVYLSSGQIIDITERKNLELQLERESTIDPLTGAYNRRYLMNHLQNLKKADDVSHTFPLTSLVVDFDHFKVINDTYGHGGGDAVLIELVNRMKRYLGDKYVLARIGGEEFVVLLPLVNEQQANDIAERIRVMCEEKSVAYNEHSIDVTVTIGVARANVIEELASLLTLADRALYKGKQQGRNQVVFA